MLIIGYLSFDASVKIHCSGRYASTKTSRTGYGGINGYIRHIDRGTDRRNGCEVHHSNPDIDPNCTLKNESYYKDETGNWRKTNQSKDMLHAVNRRIDYARTHGARISTKGQNDTVIARPLVVQLDGDTIQGHEDTWVWDLIEPLENEFGKDNIVGFSIHRDETNVHIHAVFVPCYEVQKNDGKIKCTLSQTKFFKSPKQLAGIHKKIRKTLREKGYDVKQENKPIDEQLAGYYDKNGEWHQQGLTPDQLKELTSQKQKLFEKERELMISQQEIDTLAEAMANVQAKAQETQENLENSRRIFECQQADFENEKANLHTQMEAIIAERQKMKKMRDDADGMLEKAYAVSDICKKILEKEQTLNKDFLDFLDRYGTRNNKQYRKAVENLYKKFSEERRAKMSPYASELEDIRQLRDRNRTVDDIIKTFNSREKKSNAAGFNFF